MTVYAELVFFENYFADLLIASVTAFFLRKTVSRKRLIVSVTLLALVSAILPWFYSYARYVKIAVLTIAPFLLFRQKTFPSYLSTAATFLSVTLFFGGAAYALKIAFLRNALLGGNTYALIVLLLSVTGLCGLALLKETAKRLQRERKINGETYRVKLFCGNRSCETEGFFDSGNKVYAKNGECVTIVDYLIYNRFVGRENLVRVSTVAGEKTLRGKEGSVVIYLPNGENIIYRTQIASAPDLMIREKVILHGDAFGG